MRYFLLFILSFQMLTAQVNKPFYVDSCGNLIRNKISKTKAPKYDRIKDAMEYEFRKTVDPNINRVPKERLAEAERYMNQIKSQKTSAAIAGVNWTERGPKNVSGRTRAIMVDPNTASGLKVFAAGVAGGVWVTNDISQNPPTWTAVNDLQANLAVSCLTFDPSSTQTMYFGTGEGYFNLDAMQGNGIYKSTDAGLTWNLLASTNNANFTYVYKMVVNSTGIILAATSTGLRRSTDGGTTWTKVLGAGLGITGATSNTCYDVDIAANGDIYSTLDGSIHKSTNAGLTFGAAQTLPITAGRIELACAPNDANYVYALCENANVVNGIIRTVNGGTTWTSRTEPADADTGIPATDFSRGQAWYDLAIAVDPGNRDRLFVGGVDLFYSNDGAGTWTQISHWYAGFGFQYAHADQHIIAFQPGSSSVLYFGNDGGIFRSTNANAAAPTLTFKGDNFNVTQFYSCAIHPTALTDYYLAGAQDNGSHQFSSAGINNTVEVTGGDGAFCHIDQNQSQYQFTAYVYNDFYRSADGGNTWTNVTTTGGDFISPTDYDNVNNKLYGMRGNNNYLRWDNPQTGNTFTTVAVAGFGGYVTCVTVSPNTANRVFFGISNGDFFRVDNAHTGTPTATNISTGLPAGFPSNIEVQIGNDNHLIAVYSNYGVNSIWESIDGGTTWTSIEGNLPDMPIRWALFNPNNSDQLLIATELGVWSTDNINGVATNWGPSNTGLANTRVDMLQLRTSDNFVIAATHGRGLFSTDIFTTVTALFSADRKVQYNNMPIQFTDLSYRGISWSWDFGDGNTSTSKNPSHTYSNPGLYSVSLTINTGASTLTKTDYVQILPTLGTPYTPADGGNFETNILEFGSEPGSGTDWERGNSAVVGKNGTVSGTNAWVTGLVGNYTDNNRSLLYTPNYIFLAPGTYNLRFQTKFNTETSYDGFRLEYSTNKGTTWTALGTAVQANWYNNTNTSGSGVFPNAQAWFSGAQANYSLKTFDVSFLAGNANVAFRFNFGSDVGVTGAGAAIDDFEILGPPNASLPVNMSALCGNWEEKPILTWSTSQEIHAKGFAIERADISQNFEEIGFVHASEKNSFMTKNYQFTDDHAKLSKYFYRLKQVDLNGQFKYSNTIELWNADVHFEIYPNPNQGNFVLKTQETNFNLFIYDLQGRLIDSKTFQNFNSTENVQFNLEPGLYLLKLETGNQGKYLKLEINK